MVDVGDKQATDRRALARAVVRMSAETAAAVARGDAPKGDVVSTARIAGIQAAKRTAELIPLCHPLALSFVDVRIEVREDRVEIESRGAHQRADRRGDGGAHRGLGRGAHGLRHGQGNRARRRDRRGRAAREVGRAPRLAPRAVSTRAAVVTVSSSLARGEGEDVSGPALVRLCEAAGLEVQHEVVSDDRESILAALKRLADHDGVRFIFTTGGTGLTVDDVTPEATRPRSTARRPATPRRSGPTRASTRRSACSRAACRACAAAR